MSHITTCTACGHAYEEASEETANAPVRLCGFCFDDPMATAAKQPLTRGAEQEPQSFHDFRDRGDPMKKVYDDWRAWERNQQPEHLPGDRR